MSYYVFGLLCMCLDVYVHACAVCHAFVCILGPQEDQEPGIGVVPIPIPIPVPVVAPLVIPAVVPVPAPPVPSVPLSKFSNKKSGDKPSRKKKNKVYVHQD